MTKNKNSDDLREQAIPARSLLNPQEQLARVRQHGNPTAKRAADILVRLNQRYLVPTATQKKKIVIAFAKQNRIVYGKAYDVVRIRRGVRIDLDDQESIERHLNSLTLYEIKS